MFGKLAIGSRFTYYRGKYVKTAKGEAVCLPRCLPVGQVVKFRATAKVRT